MTHVIIGNDTFEKMHLSVAQMLRLSEHLGLNGKLLASAAALSYAASKADVVIDEPSKTILILKGRSDWFVFVWIPDYRAYADFGLKTSGFGMPTRMDKKVVALQLIDVIDFLTTIKDQFVSNIGTFNVFRAELATTATSLKRDFSTWIS